MEVTYTSILDLPIEPFTHMATYLRATSRASDQKAVLSTSQHYLRKIRRCTATGHKPIMSTEMEVEGGTYYRSTSLFDLPIESLTHVASYLRAPSRALFTVALAQAHEDSTRANIRTWRQFNRNTISADSIAALAGNQLENLDFGDIEKDLASRLRDDDIHAVLIIIDAVNKVRTLRLSNCTNIVGSCLMPLRGSLVLEKIDLSLVRDNESPKIRPAPPISFDHVLPILDSIVQRDGNSSSHGIIKCGRNVGLLAARNVTQISMHVVVIDGCTSLAFNSIPAMHARGTTVMIAHPSYWWISQNELISKCLLSVLIAKDITVPIVREWNAARLVLGVISMSALTVIFLGNAQDVVGRCVVTASLKEEVANAPTKHTVIRANRTAKDDVKSVLKKSKVLP